MVEQPRSYPLPILMAFPYLEHVALALFLSLFPVSPHLRFARLATHIGSESFNSASSGLPVDPASQHGLVILRSVPVAVIDGLADAERQVGNDR